MDNLERFIRENRAEFDSGVPSLDVWAKLDQHLDSQQGAKVMPMKSVWMRRLRAAAAVAVLLLAGGAIGSYLGSSEKPAQSLADVSPEHAEMERYFNEQVEQKMARLAAYHQDGVVQADIQELDTMYAQLKHELENAPAGAEEHIIEAMIETYQTKIDILEKVLEKVEQKKPVNIDSDEVSL